MRWWRERLEQDGYDRLRDRRKGKVSEKRGPLAICEKVMELHSLAKQALQDAGLVARRKKRTPNERRRPRKERPGIPAAH